MVEIIYDEILSTEGLRIQNKFVFAGLNGLKKESPVILKKTDITTNIKKDLNTT